MLKVENFHKIRRFVYAVVNQNRGMHQLAHTRTPGNHAADIGETSEKLDVFDDGVAESPGGGGGNGPGIGKNFLQVC